MSGVPELRGFYNVSEFRLNNKIIPYSPFDTVRWQEATFEKWSTLTYKVNKPVQLDLSNGGGAPMRDINRTFEVTGTAGGRRVFYYDADTVNNVLYLQDKNIASNRRDRRERNNRPREKGQTEAVKVAKESKRFIPASALSIIGSEDFKIDQQARSTRRTRGIEEESKEKINRNKMILRYSTSDGSRVILTFMWCLTGQTKNILYQKVVWLLANINRQRRFNFIHFNVDEPSKKRI
jgi:hypothetical protein